MKIANVLAIHINSIRTSLHGQLGSVCRQSVKKQGCFGVIWGRDAVENPEAQGPERLASGG